MHSTLKPKPSDDPHDVLVVAPDVVQIAPADQELSNLLHDAARYLSDAHTHTGSDVPAGPPLPPVDTTFRPAINNVQIPDDRASIGRRAVRALTGFLLVACIGAAAIAWQSSGNVAKQIIAKWAPQFILTSLPPLENPALPAQPTPPAVETATANAAPQQPAPLAQTAPEGVAPTTATLSPGEPQLLQSMAGDLATVGQEIEQLKASIEQLKASQGQMSRDIAKASEQNLRPKISAPPPRSTAAPARKPMPPFPPPQAAAAPTSPQVAAPSVPRQPEPQPQATAQPQDESVPRPPMPVR
jgi:hypothetical protein